MKDAQKPDHVSLNTLIGRLKEGRYVIPDFQREFEWRPWDIRDLMRSIFLDYYIGSLLLWKGKDENFNALSCEIVYGFDNTKGQHPWTYGSGRPEYIVLDGQQRLTALYYAFVAPDVPLPNRQSRAIYYVHVDRFMSEEYDVAFQYDWYSRRFSKIVKDRQLQYREHIFPLSVLGAGRYDLPNWLQGYQEYWEKAAARAAESGDEEAAEKAKLHADNAEQFGEHVAEIAEQYQIAYVELDKDLEVDKVCDIFTQINSRGIRLDVFDLINALLKPKGLQLKHMWRKASNRLAFVEFEKMNVYVLQVMSILCQSYCSPKYLYYLLPGQEKQIRNEKGDLLKDVLIPNTGEFEKRWAQAVDALEEAINLLRHPHEFGVTSSQYLPYVTILPVFSSLQVACKQLPPSRRLEAQRKIRHWYWASVFINRYSGSVESTSARDYLDVRAWMEDNEATPPPLREFQERFRSLDLRKETKKGTSVYNGIFNLLVMQGARDWVSGNIPQPGDLDDHHIVPASWCAKHGLNANTILNRTPMTADTNRSFISDRLPNAYLPDLIASSNEDEVQRILESHFISPNAREILMRTSFGPDDYEAFLTERQRTILEAIENLLIKGRLDLTKPLRELDQRIEETELALRRCVASTLENDPEKLPSHIAQAIRDRIDKAARKNAAIDADNFQDLSARLEYADLRELQVAITSKATWQLFAPRFANQPALNTKFDQLAELRNGIRHSRTVNEVARKEGEAAILWFQQVLGR